MKIMKILIITALSVFVIALGVTMFLTGTFRQIASRYGDQSPSREAGEIPESVSDETEVGDPTVPPLQADIPADAASLSDEGENSKPQESKAERPESRKAGEIPSRVAECEEEGLGGSVSDEVKVGDSTAAEAKLQAKLADYRSQIAAEEARLAAIKREIRDLSSVKASITRSQQLAKIYSSMRPDSAASILCELEEILSMRILTQMNNRTSGRIMDAIAKTDPSYAAKLSNLMAES